MPNEQAVCVGFGTNQDSRVDWTVPSDDDPGWDGAVILLFGDPAREEWRSIKDARELAININAACDTAEAHRDYLINEGLWSAGTDDNDDD